MNDQLTSKRNIIQTGLILVFAVGLFGTFGVLSIFKVLDDLDSGKPLTKTMFIVPIIFLPFAIYSIHYALSRFPQMTIDKTGITLTTIFKTKNYQWNEVKDIEITGKQFHKFLFVSMPIEATTIHLNDNSDIYLWVDYYRNKSELRLILDRANSILQANRQFSSLDFSIDRPGFSKQLSTDNDGKEFNGNHFLTFNGLIFYGWIVFFTYLILTSNKIQLNNIAALIAMPLVLLSIPALLSYQMHYFIVGQNYLTIKNTIWFWKKDIYLLNDIKEVVIETPHRLSTSLRIITTDYRDKLYPAGSLSDSTWKEMMEQISKDKIQVRNEAIF